MTLLLLARAWALVMGVMAALSASPVSAGHPNALWRVVHGLCLRDVRLSGRPAPCMAVNREQGWAVVPDPRRRSQVLLVSTTRLPGIESPALLEPNAFNYWQAAWDARRYFERRLGRAVPRDRVGLAINSAYSRSQNQLHIHIDCVKPEVRSILKANEAAIGPAWSDLDVPLAGHLFKVRRLDGEDLGERNPFVLLARGDPAARGRMGLETLAVIGAVFADGSPGFYLLSDHVDLGHADAGFGEGLLDHGCAVMRDP